MSGWYRVDLYKEMPDGEMVLLKQAIDGIVANSHLEAYQIARMRNPLRPDQYLATQPVTGWRNRKAVLANQRRTEEIVEMYEIAEKFR